MPTSGSISVDSEGLDPEVEAPACSAPATGHDLDPKRRGINSRRPNVQSVGMVDGGLCLPSPIGSRPSLRSASFRGRHPARNGGTGIPGPYRRASTMLAVIHRVNNRGSAQVPAHSVAAGQSGSLPSFWPTFWSKATGAAGTSHSGRDPMTLIDVPVLLLGGGFPVSGRGRHGSPTTSCQRRAER
jgi:hypothetical protein